MNDWAAPDNQSPDGADDLSPLAWVHHELRRSLEAAHKALRRYLRESEGIGRSDVDVVDPSVLRAARSQLHQGAGALELVGLPEAAQVLRASEAAVVRMATRPAMATAAAVDAIEKSSFALLDFLTRQLVGKPVSPVLLFPQYRAVQELAGADRVHPADLWPTPWQWQALPRDRSATPRVADDAARSVMESLTLSLMRRSDRATLTRMSNLCADLGAGSRGADRNSGAGTGPNSSHLATFWHLSASMFEAQAAGLLTPDLYTKRVASRLLAQLKSSIRGQNELSNRLAQDLLFFCAQAATPSAAAPAPRLAAVRLAWQLEAQIPVDYETPRLGRFDPAVLALARKRVASAKETWSAAAAGEQHRLGGLVEQFSLVGDSLQRLFPGGARLAQSLQAAAAQTVAKGGEPAAPLAMEVATGMLYVDACIEDGEFDHPQLEARVQHLAQRIDDQCQGAEPRALESWMEELYRRVSDRQTLGSVVQELRASLSEAEKRIDQYFRSPSQRELLIPVPAQLSAMRGVLSVLGMDQAAQAVLRMRDDVDALAQTEVDPPRAIQTGTFDHLADNLGALSFLIDMISVQPQLAKSLFHFDPQTGKLAAVMGRSDRVSAFADFDDAPGALSAAQAPEAGEAGQADASPPLAEQLLSLASALKAAGLADADLAQQLDSLSQQAVVADEPGLARTLDTAREALLHGSDDPHRVDLRADLAQRLIDLQAHDLPEPQAAPAPLPPARPAAPGSTGLEDDPEMREIFIEESREVVAEAAAALNRLADAPESVSDMTTVRRAFHTLKGSSRMVGLRDFGDAAWACEQLFNARIAQSERMDQALRSLTSQALNYLGRWTEAIAAGRDEGHRSGDVAMAADALRTENRLLPVALPTGAALAELELNGAQPRGDEPELQPAGELAIEAQPAAGQPSPLFADLSTLAARVPDLPSAADLELTTPAPAAPPAPSLEPAIEELAFELDLGDLGWAEEAQSAPAPMVPADTPPLPEGETFELDISDWGAEFGPALDAHPDAVAVGGAVDEPTAEPPPAERPTPMAMPEEEPVKVIGPLRISIPLFNIFLNEADEVSRRLCTELAEWALEHERHALSASSVARAHSLAGSSATVGYAELSALARALERAMTRSAAAGPGRADEPALFCDAAEEIRRLLHQFAAGFLRPVAPGIMARLEQHESLPAASAQSEFGAIAQAGVQAAADAAHDGSAGSEVDAGLPTREPPVPVSPFAPLARDPALVFRPGTRADAFDDDEDIDAQDALDEELFPLFEEEADELLPLLQAQLRDWFRSPALDAPPLACMRTLHTFKGGARLAGAMRLGEMAHRLETAIEHLATRGAAQSAQVEPLLVRVDAMMGAFESLRRTAYLAPAAEPPAAPAPTAAAHAAPVETDARPAPPPAVPAPAAVQGGAGEFDWQRFAPETGVGALAGAAAPPPSMGAAVRVRAALLDRLVNQAGEVSITRSRIDADVKQLQGSLVELTDSLDRMRRQLRDIELQAETQISTRLEAAKAASQDFDPLEMDRFTRFQELTRFMAESVNDVATLQRSLRRTLQSTEDQLAAQARLTRELQDDLLRTRMVEFESLADRLYRTVRQAAKETSKQVRMDIVGGAIEVDRGVLDRMTGPFEHLLRNSVVHGIETLAQRAALGKEGGGHITVSLAQVGNELALEFSDDGSGLDLERIRQRGVEKGLLMPGQAVSDAELTQLIFSPGFSTAQTVTELAGRGVGLDVVRAEVNAIGGRIETSSAAGRGTRFKLLLPLTTAVTQVVMLRCADLTVAVPSSLVEVVRRVPTAEVETAYLSGRYTHGQESLPFFWLASLLQVSLSGSALRGRNQAVVVIRSASQRVALHVDEVAGNQEVVVKNIGPQLARLPGLAGVTLLPSGAAALIYNPVALATLYADSARALRRSGTSQAGLEPAAPLAPLVLVVDDSLTVRRVTQRLLLREGYRVQTAKDGLDAIERLAQERPAVLLSDIEMPRMDGFDLVRNVRADKRLADLPVIMITSRIAQKHRDHASQLGVDHYLGKPYAEDELLALVARYVGADIPS